MSKTSDDQYSEREAKKRFEAALKAAVNTPPKPLKDVAKKRDAKQQAGPKNPLKNKG